MAISLTELRQRLFQLADKVIETGEPLIVMRKGVRLRLVRDEPETSARGRLDRLESQPLVLGPPLDPHESPAQWSELPAIRAAEAAAAEYAAKPRAARRRRT